MDRMEWRERAAVENMKFGHAVADGLLKSAETLFGWLLVLLGAGVAYVLKAWEGGQGMSPSAWAAMGMVGCWLVVAAVLLRMCICTRDLHGVWSDPAQLQAADGASFDLLRQAELEWIGKRIDSNRARIADVARWLDYCRHAALWLPVAVLEVVWLLT